MPLDDARDPPMIPTRADNLVHVAVITGNIPTDRDPADIVATADTLADNVVLTPKIARVIAAYHPEDVRAEFERLLALARWGGGERWRRANSPRRISPRLS